MTLNLQGFRKNVAGLLAGQLMRLGLQAAYFIVLARMLGTSEYGAFAAALALGALVAPFSSLGAHSIMVRNVARAPSVAAGEWRRALVYSLGIGLLLTGLLTVLADFIAPPELSRLGIFLVVVADIVALKLVELSGGLWQALGKSKSLIVLPALVNSFRLLAAVGALFLAPHIELEQWSLIYLAATLPIGVGSGLYTTIKLGKSRASLWLRWRDIREGILFSVATSAQNVYNDIDKAMLARIGNVAQAGLYSAAYRVIDMGYAPIRAVASAAYPLYFREGEHGLVSAMALTRRIAPAVVALGAVAAVGAFFVAPLTPLLLGSEFSGAIILVQLISPLILLRGVSYLAADTLTGCGRQAFRTAAQVGIAIVNVALNFVFIPVLGVMGAVIVTLACETLLAVVLWLYIGLSLRRLRSRRGRRRMASHEIRGRKMTPVGRPE